MKATNVLMIVAVFAVALAVFNLAITMNKVSDIERLTGFATDTGDVNLTVESNAEVNFTANGIDWGTGYVADGSTEAYLNTNGTNVGSTNWDVVSTGLILENTGNENVTLNFTSSADAATFIGPSAEFKINVSENETGSCFTGLVYGGTYNDINDSLGLQYCTNFGYEAGRDSIYLDVLVKIPSEGITTESKGAVITATATSV